MASGTLDAIDWNAELVRGDVVDALRRLKEQPGRGISPGGVKLPATLAGHGLIHEYTFVVRPVIAGRGPRLLNGADQKLELIERWNFESVAIMKRYRPV